MKILISTMSYPPYVSGVSTFVWNLTSYLSHHGHTVRVIAPSNGWKSSKEESPTGVIVFRVPGQKNPVHKRLHVPVLRPDQVAKHLDDFQPDIVHLQDPMPLSRMFQRAATKRKIPIVATHHTSIALIMTYVPELFQPLSEPTVAWWLAQLYNRCTLVTSPTNTMAKLLREYGVTTEIRGMSNGVDVTRFAKEYDRTKILDAFDLDPTLPLVISVGRVDTDKSVDVCVDSLLELKKTKDIQAVIIGDGDLLNDIKRQVQRAGASSSIHFVGKISHDSDQLPALMRAADCFITCSTIETQGIAALEAMAAGNPIVAANALALPEVVKDGENGFLVEPGDVTGFADAMTNILNDATLRERMSRRSQEIVAPHRLPAPLEAFEKLYQELM